MICMMNMELIMDEEEEALKAKKKEEKQEKKAKKASKQVSKKASKKDYDEDEFEGYDEDFDDEDPWVTENIAKAMEQKPVKKQSVRRKSRQDAHTCKRKAAIKRCHVL